MPQGRPGCIIAAACYQDRLFDARVRALNKQAILTWRARFRAMFEEISVKYPARQPVDLNDLADMVSSAVEGGIILSKALNEPQAVGRQVMQLRTYVKLLFSANVD